MPLRTRAAKKVKLDKDVDQNITTGESFSALPSRPREKDNHERAIEDLDPHEQISLGSMSPLAEPRAGFPGHTLNQELADAEDRRTSSDCHPSLPGTFPSEHPIKGIVGSCTANGKAGEGQSATAIPIRKRKYSQVTDLDGDEAEDEGDSHVGEVGVSANKGCHEGHHSLHLGTTEESKAQFEITRLIPNKVLIQNIDVCQSMNVCILNAAAEYIEYLIGREKMLLEHIRPRKRDRTSRTDDLRYIRPTVSLL